MYKEKDTIIDLTKAVTFLECDQGWKYKDHHPGRIILQEEL